MITMHGNGTERRDCVVCHHRTGDYIEYGYARGISIKIPCCDECKKKLGAHLRFGIEIVLKSAQESVRTSRLIEAIDEWNRELRAELKEAQGNG